MEDATPKASSTSCSVNAHVEWQVTKAFWDMDDTNNEASIKPANFNDVSSYTTSFIASGWDVFPNGTGNREDKEDDADGVNVWDYYENNKNRVSNANGLLTTLVYHNCLADQDYN